MYKNAQKHAKCEKTRKMRKTRKKLKKGNAKNAKNAETLKMRKTWRTRSSLFCNSSLRSLLGEKEGIDSRTLREVITLAVK